jgi:hypothetical protein
MRIITPTAIEQVAWEGELEPLAEAFKSADLRPRVTLGEPAWWPAEEALEKETGKRWSPPASGRRYTLLRLACTLHPPGEARARYSEAALGVSLRPRRARAGPVVAHDLLPQRITVEQTTTLKAGLKPDLKLGDALEVSLLEVGAEIEVPQVFPAVQAYGLGESHVEWRFAHHAARPLLGCQSVYAVLDAPGEAGGVRLTVELVATLETRFGPIRLGLPAEAQAHISRVVGVQEAPAADDKHQENNRGTRA